MVAPQSRDVSAGLARKDLFVVVQEMFQTDTIVHVENIIVTRTTAGKKKAGQAEVLVFDQYGNPVPGAVVFGKFNLPNDTVKNGITGSDGVALISGDKTKDSIAQFCFEVIDIELSGAIYDPSQNVVISACE